MSTPKPSSQKNQPGSGSQSNKNQKSILGFFQKKSTNSPSPVPSSTNAAKFTPTATLSKKSFTRPQPVAALTPQPSSDAPEQSSPILAEQDATLGRNKENGLPSPVSPSDTEANRAPSEVAGVALSSPSRKVRNLTEPYHDSKSSLRVQTKKTVNYAESDDEDDEPFQPIANNARKGRATKRRRVSLEDSDDEFDLDDATQQAMLEDGACGSRCSLR